MTRVIVDSTLKEKLLGLSLPLELCDDAGRVMAHVTPVDEHGEYEPAGPQISRDELRRRANSSERRFSTSEVLKHLESL